MKTFDKLRKGDKIFVCYFDAVYTTYDGIVLKRKGRCLAIVWNDGAINEWHIPDEYVGKSNWANACTNKELMHQIKAKHSYEENKVQLTKN